MLAFILVTAIAFTELSLGLSVRRNWAQPPSWPDHYTLNITQGEAAPDGVTRPVFLINGRTPGPTVHAYEGKQICVSMSSQFGPRFR